MRSNLIKNYFKIARATFSVAVLCLCTVTANAESVNPSTENKNVLAPQMPANKNAKAAKVPVEKTPQIFGSLVVSQQASLPATDYLYQQYIAKTDANVENIYKAGWAYHEKQVAYSMASYRNEHLSIGSRDMIGRAPYEGDVRGAFANQVLRMRVDAAMRAYFATPERVRTIQRAQKTLRAIDSIKNTSVSIGSAKNGGTPAEIRVGYDVISDSSKVEVSRGKLMLGLYHPHLVGAMSGGAAFNALSMRMTASFGPTDPSAYVAYRMAVSAVDFGVSKPLTPRTSGRFVASQTIGYTPDPNVNNYQVIFNYSF